MIDGLAIQTSYFFLYAFTSGFFLFALDEPFDEMLDVTRLIGTLLDEVLLEAREVAVKLRQKGAEPLRPPVEVFIVINF